MKSWGFLAVTAVGVACNPAAPREDYAPQTTANDPWLFAISKPWDSDVPMFNATLGMNVSGNGVAARATVLLMRDNRLLEAAVTLGSRVMLDGKPLSPGSHFKGALNLRDGTWQCEWQQDGATVRVYWLLDPTAERIARRIEVMGTSGALQVDPPSSEQVLLLHWVSDLDRGNTTGMVRVRSRTFARGARITNKITLPLSSGGTASGPVLVEDLVAFDDEPPASYDLLYAKALNVWKERWRADIEIEGPIEDQRAIRACLFSLYAGGNPKLPPFGTSNSKYRGHRFWDAEAWMLPVYALLAPEVARQATDWRVSTTAQQLPGWETGADGSDVTPPSHRNAIHIWGWVHWWLERALALNLVSNPEDARRAMHRVAEGFLSRAEKTERGLEFRNVLSPDEGRLRDNDLVTNLLARQVLFRQYPELASRVVLPRAKDDLLASWDGDHLKGYQQTSALLALYPLEWPLSLSEAEAMFHRYVGLTSRNGPAMSDSVHATIAARLAASSGESTLWRHRAYKLWRESWQPFLDPVGGFSERRNAHTPVFLTGAAGCLQAVIYGFAGLRLARPGEEVEGKVLMPLSDGWSLVGTPALPPEWRSLTLRGVWLLGRRYTIHVAREGNVSLRQEE